MIEYIESHEIEEMEDVLTKMILTAFGFINDMDVDIERVYPKRGVKKNLISDITKGTILKYALPLKVSTSNSFGSSLLNRS